MKKYLIVALAALLVLGFAASSFAIHAEIPAESQAVVATGATQITIGGDIRVRGLMDNNTSDFNSDGRKAGDDSKWDQRVRLSIEAKVSPNTTGMIQLEAGDPTSALSSDIRNWGTEASSATGNLKVGDGKQDAMRVLQAWILHQGSGLLGVPALVKIGHMPIQIDGLFYSHTKFGDDALLLGVDPIKGLHLIVGTVKLSEGANSLADDVNGYTFIGKYDINKDTSVGLDITYADGQNLAGHVVPPAMSPDLHLWNFAANAKTRIAGLGIKGELDFESGKQVQNGVGVPDVKFRGYAGTLDFDYKINPVTLMLGAAYGSGEDLTKTDHKVREFVTTLENIQHYTFIYEYLTMNAQGFPSGGIQNTWFLKAAAKADIVKNLDGMLSVYYLRVVNDYGKAISGSLNPISKSKDLGTEVDFIVNYQIDKNLKYYVEGGYLFAGNFWRNTTTKAAGQSPDDPWALRHGIQLSF